MVDFVVPITPMGKQRHRNNGRMTYTPKKTTDHESIVALYAKPHFPEPIEPPVYLRIIAYMPIPKSGQNSKKNSGDYHTVKPDFDNISKIVSDALNGIAYADDKAVAHGEVIKLYSGNPRYHITVKNLDITI